MPRLPNCIVIGAMKCGTTSLHHYLNLHPQVDMTGQKELNFFVKELNYPKGGKWYEAHFKKDTRVTGESSPNYSAHPFFSGVPMRMFSALPKARLIYLVRDPFERMVSHYIHKFCDGREQRSFTQALSDPGLNMYVFRSRYHWQLEQYLAYYPLDQIRVVPLEDLKTRPREIMKDLFTFLGVEPDVSLPDLGKVRHRSKNKRQKTGLGILLKQLSESRLVQLVPSETRRRIGKVLYLPFSRRIERPVVDATLREQLQGIFLQDTKQLKALTGLPFDNWSI